MDDVRIRQFEPSDYDSLAHVHDLILPDHPYFLKRIKYEDSCYGRTRYQMKRVVAQTASGAVVGFGEYKHLFFKFHPLKFALDIEVLPEWQEKGVRTVLYERLMDELAKIGAETVWPLVLSAEEPAIEFYREHGFVEKRKTIESWLDLERFRSVEFVQLAEQLETEGIAIANLSSELERNPNASRKLKELEESGAGDVPGAIVDAPMNFQDYETVILRSPIMVWEGSFVAKEGGAYVGESSLLESEIDGVIDQGFTVVRPSHRGRNIAQVVKLRTAQYARSKGARFIRTYNDSQNHSMLAVNRKMGFAKRAEWITLERNL